MTTPIAAWYQGSVTSSHTPAALLHSPGLLIGQGIFETLFWGPNGPVALDAHYDRLSQAAPRVGLMPPCRATVERALQALSQAATGANSLRITWFAKKPSTSLAEAELLVTISEAPRYAATARVTRSTHVVNEHSATAGLKTTSYLDNALARREALAAGADEALLANTAGNVCEGSASNVFFAKNNQLVTPPLGNGALPGITRALFCEYAQRHGVPTTHEETSWTQAQNRGTLILTSSLRGATPVEEFDGRSCQIEPWVHHMCTQFTTAYRHGQC